MPSQPRARTSASCIPRHRIARCQLGEQHVKVRGQLLIDERACNDCPRTPRTPRTIDDVTRERCLVDPEHVSRCIGPRGAASRLQPVQTTTRARAFYLVTNTAAVIPERARQLTVMNPSGRTTRSAAPRLRLAQLTAAATSRAPGSAERALLALHSSAYKILQSLPDHDLSGEKQPTLATAHWATRLWQCKVTLLDVARW
jgi:hypothetical protein